MSRPARPLYVALSRLAHAELLRRGEPTAPEDLARAVGLSAPGAAGLLPRLLDPRFRAEPDGLIGLWRWHRPFPVHPETVVVLDIEATGGHLERDELIEVGAVRLGPEGHREFSALNDPGRPIPPFIVGLTGITDEMVRGAPPLAETLPALLDFIGPATLVIQNARHDLAFLAPRFARVGCKLEVSAVDTLDLARRTLPGRRKRGLSNLAWVYGAPAEARHRALGDARATLAVARELYFALFAGREVTLRDLHREGASPAPTAPASPDSAPSDSAPSDFLSSSPPRRS